MKKLLFLLILVSSSTKIFSNAVAIVDATDKIVLRLISSTVNVQVTNQVAVVTSTQVFVNQLLTPAHIKYAFPIYEDACATGLRWKLGGVWYAATFSPAPQDTTLPGSGGQVDPDLIAYLGATPLYFDLNNYFVAPDSTITFELTYVQLLHYAFNITSFAHPNDYSLIQLSQLQSQSFSFHAWSDRTIVSIDLISVAADTIWNTTSEAGAAVVILNAAASTDYYLEYSLDPNQLGLFSFSTFLPGSMNECDSLGSGFFAFIVEPDPNDSVIIHKVFTLIIDRSGSMGGDKIQQARDAATYVVNNLNSGDKFNIVVFDSQVSTVFPDHVDVNPANQATALNYISTIGSGGSTNISGAFDVAIPQFSNSDPTVANVIIFMTDGVPTAGITNASSILSHVHGLIATNMVEGLSINTFGIGYDVNTSLLAELALQNNGLSQFFSSGDLLQVITDFYASIQNPLMLNTSMTFSPQVISEVYPNPLPNLYVGHQLVVVGRYNQPGPVDVIFSGIKNGDTVHYNYSCILTDSLIVQNSFLTKLWAIEKINSLMVTYYTLDPQSQLAITLQNEIIELSLCYGVLSPFTSFSSGDHNSVGVDEIADDHETFRLKNWPNPFKTSTEIFFDAPVDLFRIVPCIILDMNGRIIKVLEIFVGNKGRYHISWNGKDENGATVSPGTYPYYIQLGDQKLYGVMEKM